MHPSCHVGWHVGVERVSAVDAAGLESQITDLEKALAEAKSASEQSDQQAAQQEAAETKQLRTQVQDLQKSLEDSRAELVSVKVRSQAVMRCATCAAAHAWHKLPKLTNS